MASCCISRPIVPARVVLRVRAYSISGQQGEEQLRSLLEFRKVSESFSQGSASWPIHASPPTVRRCFSLQTAFWQTPHHPDTGTYGKRPCSRRHRCRFRLFKRRNIFRSASQRRHVSASTLTVPGRCPLLPAWTLLHHAPRPPRSCHGSVQGCTVQL